MDQLLLSLYCIAILDIQMIQGDFLKLRTKDWRDADIVFTNSTCYDEKLMESLAKLASTYDY